MRNLYGEWGGLSRKKVLSLAENLTAKGRNIGDATIGRRGAEQGSEKGFFPAIEIGNGLADTC
jgi:hypothetical protein